MSHLYTASSVRDNIERLLAPVDAEYAKNYPYDPQGRQPVHSVYVPGHIYTPELPKEWGEKALAAVNEAGGMGHLIDVHGLVTDPEEKALIALKVEEKLATEPIEDLRIDFEDGYGSHPDEDEDAAVIGSANHLGKALTDGVAPPFVGIRFKAFDPRTRERGLRTVELFVETLAPYGLPENLILTLPMVTHAAQIEAMVIFLEGLEKKLGLPDGRLTFEIQIETPQAILGLDGRSPIGPMIAAGRGRITGMPYGTYDYSASVGIAAAYQSLEHPSADFAKAIMQASTAGTGVRLSDGSTNIMPVGAGRDEAWKLHGRLITRSLQRGFYQGWDLHPAQLPSRYAATFAFFRASLDNANTRLAAYLGQGAAEIMDEPATARALADFLLRGLHCGAMSEDEIAVSTEQLTELIAP